MVVNLLHVVLEVMRHCAPIVAPFHPTKVPFWTMNLYVVKEPAQVAEVLRAMEAP